MNTDFFAKNDTVLIITDQLPYPPRNGITLPVYNYAIGLRKTKLVKILLLVDKNASPTLEEFIENESIFGKMEVVYLEKKNRYQRLINEILGLEMYQHGWRLLADQIIDYDKLKADIIISSPMSAVAKWQSSNLQNKIQYRLSLAAVNDCTTAEYYFRWLQSFGGIKLAFKGFLHRIRSYRIAKIEKKLLLPYSHILLQTSKDKHLMGYLVSNEIEEKVVCVPNGVRAEYFLLSPMPKKSQVLFVAELSGEYAPVTRWVINDLWREILKRHPESQLIIVGRGASDELKENIRTVQNIVHIEFIEDLGRLYSESTVVLCPIFKGYGLINKTIEAMAASVPVVGGVAAFNGIDNFQPGIHGVVCNTKNASKFAEAVVDIICDTDSQAKIGSSARNLLIEQFSWESTVNKIEALM